MDEKKEKEEYFAYCRESKDLETGITIQKEKIEKYAEYTNIKIVKWFIDNDQSAYKFRPNYDKMMKELQTVDVKGLVCTHLFRFGRSTAEVLMEHNKIKKMGKDLIFTEHQIDSKTTVGKAMLGMLAVFADFEHDTILERLECGRAYAKKTKTKSGLPMNRPPVEIDWKEFDEYRKNGASVAFICKKVVDKRTGKKMSKSAFYKAVKKRKSE